MIFERPRANFQAQPAWDPPPARRVGPHQRIPPSWVKKNKLNTKATRLQTMLARTTSVVLLLISLAPAGGIAQEWEEVRPGGDTGCGTRIIVLGLLHNGR